MERKLREAPIEVGRKVSSAVRKVLIKHLDSYWADPGMSAEVAEVVEKILGPFDRKVIGDFTVRFTKLQAEPDGYHEYVTLHFV